MKEISLHTNISYYKLYIVYVGDLICCIFKYIIDTIIKMIMKLKMFCNLYTI